MSNLIECGYCGGEMPDDGSGYPPSGRPMCQQCCVIEGYVRLGQLWENRRDADGIPLVTDNEEGEF